MTDRIVDFSLAAEADDIENLYLTFEVAGETYAANIRYVTEIVGLQRISAVPDVPNFIRGAMNLRGKVIPVMDVRLRFKLPARDYDDRTTIIVLDLEGVPTGLVVDQVTDVLSIPKTNIDPPPHWREGGNETGVICGLGKHGDRVSIILDVPRLLNAQEVHLNLPEAAEA